MPLNIKSPINYFPLKVGNTTIEINKNNVTLNDGVENWMGYDSASHWQACEFFVELELAYGKCVTTGLGLGILQTLLAQKNEVTEIIVYEKNIEIIEMFETLTKQSNIDISKIVIINEDANNIQGITCDCMFLDHFEYEPHSTIVETVKKIASENTVNVVWFWPSYHVFVKYCTNLNKTIDKSTFIEWSETLNINKFPNSISESLLDNLKEFIDGNWPSRFKVQIENIKNKNKLINLFKKNNEHT